MAPVLCSFRLASELLRLRPQPIDVGRELPPGSLAGRESFLHFPDAAIVGFVGAAEAILGPLLLELELLAVFEARFLDAPLDECLGRALAFL